MFHQVLSALALASVAFVFVSPFTTHSLRGASFADLVVSYDPGAGAAARFRDPASALGEPSRINPFGEATDPFNPPYGTNQVVSIGAGGHLVVGFATPVLNHPHNPFGRDFSIYGNAGFIITNEFDLVTFDWVGHPSTDGSMFGASSGEVLVSVSRNGTDFYLLNPGLAPAVDSFAPTDASGDFGLPVVPGLSALDFAGAGLDAMRDLYAGSAGGASFDLNWALDSSGRAVFLPEVRFVRVDVVSGRAEIDGFAVTSRWRGSARARD